MQIENKTTSRFCWGHETDILICGRFVYDDWKLFVAHVKLMSRKATVQNELRPDSFRFNVATCLLASLFFMTLFNLIVILVYIKICFRDLSNISATVLNSYL